MAIPEYTPEELAKEAWRDVVGYEGWYAVSDLGRVKRTLQQGGGRVGRILKSHCSKRHGYPQLTLSRNNIQYGAKVHVLVARAFLGPCPEGKEINHIDANRANPRLTNLEYLTHIENEKHKCKLGRQAKGETHMSRTRPDTLPRGDDHYTRKFPEKVMRGEKNGKAKLNEEKVRSIRKDERSGTVIARELHVDPSLIRMVKRLEIWKHVV